MNGSLVVQSEVVSPSTTKASQINDLYDQYEPMLCQLVMAMEAMHEQYLLIASPIVLDLADLAAEGRCVVMDDFIESLHAHSAHLKQQAHGMMDEFHHQRRAASNLARLAR
jgi:hypothetical protein